MYFTERFNLNQAWNWNNAVKFRYKRIFLIPISSPPLPPPLLSKISEPNATAFPSHHLSSRKKIALVLPKPLPRIFDREKKTTTQSPSSPSSISADFAHIVQQQFHRNPGLLIDVVQQQEASINSRVQMLHGPKDIITGDEHSEQSLNSTPKSDDLSIFQDTKCNQDSEEGRQIYGASIT